MLIVMVTTSNLFGQVMGNVNYQHRIHLPQNVVKVPYPNTDEVLITVKGICNLKADHYVAIFSVTQAAETAEEVNRLIDLRIAPLQKYCNRDSSISSYVDMISFVPIYEMEVVKKIFSKKTYNEVPKGFEVKKNIHIKYSDPQLLNEIIAKASESEIYDLVRVDYFSDKIGEMKQKLRSQALSLLNEKKKYKSTILGKKLEEYDKQTSDGFTVVYPVEMYKQYQASSTNKFGIDNKANVNHAQKSNTYYYKPYFDKDFDFSIHPIVMEPVIQVMYEVKVKYSPQPEEKPEPEVKKEIQVKKDVIIITPSGDMKTIRVD